MREILFRGKRLYICDWVEGTGIFNDGTNTWISFNEPNKPIDFGMKHQTVYTETVGQFTGLTDKNGKKIFEGDIVKHYYDSQFPESYSKGVIFYDEELCRWKRTSRNLKVCIDNRCVYEVIGNIYDNPELLGGEEDG